MEPRPGLPFGKGFVSGPDLREGSLAPSGPGTAGEGRAQMVGPTASTPDWGGSVPVPVQVGTPTLGA